MVCSLKVGAEPSSSYRMIVSMDTFLYVRNHTHLEDLQLVVREFDSTRCNVRKCQSGVAVRC